MALSDVELRVLGALIEKERTTPEGYPLSSQALLTACNQRTSRDPVTDYHLQDVLAAMTRLRDRGLAETVQAVSDRVPKHSHKAAEALELDDREAALLAVLMLRGPQTPGELRTRTDRYVSFASVPDVETVLEGLAERRPQLVVRLGRGPGQSQDRWAHALGEDPDRLAPRARRRDADAEGEAPARRDGPPRGAGASNADLESRVAELEARLAALEARLEGR
jgi:uncharacterized protein YceH (UPF0502 family)